MGGGGVWVGGEVFKLGLDLNYGHRGHVGNRAMDPTTQNRPLSPNT